VLKTDSKSLIGPNEMTQTQLFDEIQVHLPSAVCLDLDEIQQVGGRDIGDASQNLVGGDGGRFHAGIDGSPNRTLLYQSRPELFRPSVPSSTRGIDSGTFRFTEVVLNAQSLSVP
jgi:hypothetical protein